MPSRSTHRLVRYPFFWLGTLFALAFVVLLILGQWLPAALSLALSCLGAIRHDHCGSCGNPVHRRALDCPYCGEDLRLYRRVR